MSSSPKLTYTDLERSRELRAAFDQLVFESLRPLTLGLGSLFLLFTGIDAFTMGLGAVMTLAAFFSAAITFTFYYWLTQNKIASQFSHPLLALLCALITLNVVLDYALRGNPAQIIYLLMLVIGAGFIFLSMRWLLFVLVISVGSWTGVSWLTGYALGLTPSAVEIIAAIVLALLMHNARLRVVGRLEELRLKDIQQNNALQHALQKAQQSEELARQQNEYLTALHRTTLTVINQLDLNELLETLLKRAGQLLGTEHGYIYLVTPDGAALERQVAVGLFAQLAGTRLMMGQGITGKVWESGQSLNVDHYDQWENRAPTFQANTIRAAVGVPLKIGERVSGVLGLAHGATIKRTFNHTEVVLLEQFAQLAAIAIENARLYTAAQQELVERKRTEAALQLAKDSAEAASRAKSTFLATMSHELRTPLSQIIGYTEILREEAAERNLPDLEADLQKIHKAGQTLLDIIADVLELARLEAGKMDLELETFDVARVVQAVVMTAQPLIEKNRNQLTVHCATGLGAMRSDRGKVQHALYHLLSNAAKFTQNGSVTLTVTRQRERVVNRNGSEAEDLPLVAPYPPLHSDWLVFRVSDTGIGMTPEQIEKIFNAFAQADSSSKRLFGGVGVGLAITKHFCRLMGGDIIAMSIYNRSSTFTMQLPAIAPVAPDPTPTETPASSHG
jgi:signal transduction histidine kinase